MKKNSFSQLIGSSTSFDQAIMPGNSKELLGVVRNYALKILSVSFSRTTKLHNRYRSAMNFTRFIVKLDKNHGSKYTIAYLKSAQLAIQRSASSEPVKSLRDLDPSMPFPRLVNGLPPMIGSRDRALIWDGHPGVIR